VTAASRRRRRPPSWVWIWKGLKKSFREAGAVLESKQSEPFVGGRTWHGEKKGSGLDK
jgi:hypothetical protein